MNSETITRLTRNAAATGAVTISHGPVEKFPEKIIQFGEGNFLRGFTDWMVDHINSEGFFQGGIVAVQPLKQGLANVLNEQDGIYTVLLRGIQGGERTEERRVVTAINRCLNPYDEWTELLETARQPGIRFIISNTTEAGIVYVSESYNGVNCPASFPAKVAALLLERFRSLGGGPDTGWVFLPCELIEANGAKLKKCVLKHAASWNAGPDFIDWLQSANYFLNTLVDRIVPGYPGAESAKLAQELGYEDKLIVAGEVFHLWVIEGPQHLAEEIPFHKAGLNVIWTDDMTPYRTRKVRVLNGAHTSSVLGAYLAGIDTVGALMDDVDFGPAVRRAVFDEILAIPVMASDESRGYAEAVLERFRNPFIRHELLSITLNSVSKWKVRVLPSLLDHVEALGTTPPMLVFSLASLIRFYDGKPVSDTELRGDRFGTSYPVRDDAPVLAFFAREWASYHADPDVSRLVASVLSNGELWGKDLTSIPGLAAAVGSSLNEIINHGARQALLKLS
jgi:tagaturonate reductase